MSWLAILLALAAMPAALLERRVAVGLILVAALLVAREGVRPRVRAVAAFVLAAAMVITGWSIAAINSPSPDDVPDAATYARKGASREVLLPLEVHVEPITRLALLEFVPGADPVYKGFEVQYLDRGVEQGYRVLGYRNDGRTDYFDDLALTPEPDLRSQVTGRGLHKYRHTSLGEPVIERDAQGRTRIRAAFTDLTGRRVDIDVEERVAQPSRPFSLLAPIGATSVKPDSFPLFMMGEFDFVRSADSRVDVRIDGRPLRLGAFPPFVPIQGQARSQVKCSTAAEIIEVFPTAARRLRRVATEPGSDRVVEGAVTYLFDGDALERIRVHDHEIVFTPALALDAPGEGQWRIESHRGRGGVVGEYTKHADGDVTELALTIEDVRLPHQPDLGIAVMIRALGFFERWPKGYEYHATINRALETVEARWVNRTPTP